MNEDHVRRRRGPSLRKHNVLPLVVALLVGLAPVLMTAPASSAATAATRTTVTVPSTPVGLQLSWLLGIQALPLSSAEITSHFGAAFVATISPAELNSVL